MARYPPPPLVIDLTHSPQSPESLSLEGGYGDSPPSTPPSSVSQPAGSSSAANSAHPSRSPCTPIAGPSPLPAPLFHSPSLSPRLKPVIHCRPTAFPTVSSFLHVAEMVKEGESVSRKGKGKVKKMKHPLHSTTPAGAPLRKKTTLEADNHDVERDVSMAADVLLYASRPPTPQELAAFEAGFRSPEECPECQMEKVGFIEACPECEAAKLGTVESCLVCQQHPPTSNPSAPHEDAPTGSLDKPCLEENLGLLVPYVLPFEGVENDPIGSPSTSLGEALHSEEKLGEQKDSIVMPFEGGVEFAQSHLEGDSHGDSASAEEDEALVQEGGPQVQPKNPSHGDPASAKEGNAMVVQGGPQLQPKKPIQVEGCGPNAYVVLRHESDWEERRFWRQSSSGRYHKIYVCLLPTCVREDGSPKPFARLEYINKHRIKFHADLNLPLIYSDKGNSHKQASQLRSSKNYSLARSAEIEIHAEVQGACPLMEVSDTKVQDLCEHITSFPGPGVGADA